MTDQNVPNVTDEERMLARKWAEFIESGSATWTDRIYAAARVILNDVPAPPRPTLADMTEEERAACQWMQCDAGPYGRRGLIVKVKYWSVYVVDKETGTYSDYTPDLVTARPDLPRMEWNGTDQKAEGADTPTAPDHLAVGTVIESADDPRIAALPVGSVLSDCDGETVAKRAEAWAGIGYIPIASERDEFGPWTVRRIGWEADQ